MASDETHYDIIFAGGGTCACIIASRLAKANPSLKLLILEAGPHTKENVNHIQPGRYFRNLVPLPAPTFSHHVSKPSKALGGRPAIVATGRCLGGGSSVNFAMVTRASASDYDDWETEHENPGWGSAKLIPLLKKAETYQAPGDTNIHGTSGPIKVSYASDQINVATQFLDAAAQYDKERAHTDDTTDFYSCNAYGRWPLYVDSTNGRRSDVPHHYIYNESFPNLEILTSRRVLRVILQNNRAVGVEHIDDVEGRAKGNPTSAISYASRLIVLSAGAFGSPAILERSGIGAASLLDKNKIPVIVDLPGVGENYMDHIGISAPYIASEDADTLDTIFRGKESELEPFNSQWLQDGKGLLSHNGINAGIRIRPTPEDLKTIPEFEEKWKTYFVDSPDKPIIVISIMASYIGKSPSAGSGKYYSLLCFMAYPVSTGRVHIQSGTDAYAPLDFHPGYLDEAADVAVLRWGYKHARELARRMAVYHGEFIVGHPAFPADSQVKNEEAVTPVDAMAPKIEYTPEDDKAIDDYLRQNVVTCWHSCGTCGMKPRKKGGVVDHRLNVYGVLGLKVADCSITPSNVGANTYNTAIAIGERAAVIIAEDLGIKGVTEE